MRGAWDLHSRVQHAGRVHKQVDPSPLPPNPCRYRVDSIFGVIRRLEIQRPRVQPASTQCG